MPTYQYYLVYQVYPVMGYHPLRDLVHCLYLNPPVNSCLLHPVGQSLTCALIFEPTIESNVLFKKDCTSFCLL